MGWGRIAGMGLMPPTPGAVDNFGDGRFTGEQVVHDVARIRLALAVVYVPPEDALLLAHAAGKGDHHDMLGRAPGHWRQTTCPRGG